MSISRNNQVRRKDFIEAKKMDAWSIKRRKNTQAMMNKMRTDDAYLFISVSGLLSSYSDIAWKLGDEVGAMYLSALGSMMFARHQRARFNRPSSTKSKTKKIKKRI
jgi:hypothetical protein